MFCTIVTQQMPRLSEIGWNASSYSMRAPAGQLESRCAFFHTIVSSFRPTLDWKCSVQQICQMQQQAILHNIKEIGNVATLRAKVSHEISDEQRQEFEQQQAAQDRRNQSFAEYERDEVPFQGQDGKVVELPSDCGHYYSDGKGTIIGTDDPNFDPNAAGVTPMNKWNTIENKPD